MSSVNASTASSAGPYSTSTFTHSILTEVKKFHKNINQLSILLKETNLACKEVKILDKSQLTENLENLIINQVDESFIKSLQKKKICFIVFGQNVLAQSILVNEILSMYLLPFQISSKVNEEHWRFIRIKHGKIGGYTYQLVDSEFEVMSRKQLDKKFTFSNFHLPFSPFKSKSSEKLDKNGPKTTHNKPTTNTSSSNPFMFKSSTNNATNQNNNHHHNHHHNVQSSSNFTIPIDELRIDKNLIDHHHEHGENVLVVDENQNENENENETNYDYDEPEKDIENKKTSSKPETCAAENQAILEVTLDVRLLEHNVEVYVYSKYMNKTILDSLSSNIIPVYLYGIMEDKLGEDELKELSNIKEYVKDYPILFVKIPSIEKYLENNNPLTASSTSSTSSASASAPNPSIFQLSSSPDAESAVKVPSELSPIKTGLNFLKYLLNESELQHKLLNNSNTFSIFSQLCELKCLSVLQSSNVKNSDYDYYEYLAKSSYVMNDAMSAQKDWTRVKLPIDSEFCEKWHLFMPTLCSFLKRYLKSFSVIGTIILFKFHEFCLSQFINFAFKLATDTLITPKKIEYVREKEQILYESLLSLASMKQEELKDLINSTIETHREQIIDQCINHQFVEVELISCLASMTLPVDEKQVTLKRENLQNETEDTIEIKSVPNETSSEEREAAAADATYMTVKYARDYKKCTNQIQELVLAKINNAIAAKITQSVEILKENYMGTLKRCLITLEEANISNSYSDSNSASVSEALQQIVNAAYQVEVNISGSSSFLKILILKMKELMKNMPWSASPNLDQEWKLQIATNMLNSLSESKLAKILCNQMKERLKASHNLFIASLKMLEAKNAGRLEKNEENQNLIKKILAPKFAKLCLESTSLKDYLLYGFPSLGREIGRGQYGVVYSCHKWGKFENLAVKSVVPPDEKHWNDLALEFHYTKQITDHTRIVKLIGSVIDYTYGNGSSPAVLLVMEAMKRDLYSGLKSGLDWKTRILISIDVVEGIRYLHSLGLVHRDIKLKNVLLDEHNRAKITDLGFCKPEAMMSGSIVGTPVHMCPEMFDSKYDNTVDIYAFGILFWYICSGAVTLPKNFEPCGTKDDLWSAVKRGVRPERLASFDDECWTLMEMCWKHDPKQRPHIGIVYDLLTAINEKSSTTNKKPS